MKRNRIYVSPTVKVVEMVSGSKLLDTSATLQGYEHQDNSDGNGWQ